MGHVKETACNLPGIRSSFCLGRGYDIDAPCDTEVKPQICRNMGTESLTRVACTVPFLGTNIFLNISFSVSVIYVLPLK
jgi:hypothetical protein